jgi:hypothetical protein
LKEAAGKVKEQSRIIELLQNQLQSMESKSVESSNDCSTFPSCAATSSNSSFSSSSSSDFTEMFQCDPEGFQRFCTSLLQQHPSVSRFVYSPMPHDFPFIFNSPSLAITVTTPSHFCYDSRWLEVSGLTQHEMHNFSSLAHPDYVDRAHALGRFCVNHIGVVRQSIIRTRASGFVAFSCMLFSIYDPSADLAFSRAPADYVSKSLRQYITNSSASSSFPTSSGASRIGNVVIGKYWLSVSLSRS